MRGGRGAKRSSVLPELTVKEKRGGERSLSQDGPSAEEQQTSGTREKRESFSGGKPDPGTPA